MVLLNVPRSHRQGSALPLAHSCGLEGAGALSTTKGLRRSPFSQMQSSALVTSPSPCAGMASMRLLGLVKEPQQNRWRKEAALNSEQCLSIFTLIHGCDVAKAENNLDTNLPSKAPLELEKGKNSQKSKDRVVGDAGGLVSLGGLRMQSVLGQTQPPELHTES